MKKIFFWIAIGFLIFFSIILLSTTPQSSRSQENSHLITRATETPTPTPIPIKNLQKTLFIPYWTVTKDMHVSGYDNLVYFGITATSSGVSLDDPGYTTMDQFLSSTNSATRKLLTIRMISTSENEKILTDTKMQQKIITQSIQIAKAKGFDGIVLDFEISALGFEQVTKNITSFETLFADTVKNNHLTFYATIYGDTFARFRPFDVKTIAQHADGMMIMAYDYHKANGSPGPNFPLVDNQQEGYDFKTMISDFLQQMPKEKITVVFGLYGYDWKVDDKGNSVGEATSLSSTQMEQKFINTCSFASCKWVIDPISTETKVTYTDTMNKKHIVWFETLQSVEKKTNFLKTKGISSVAYWAYSYF